MSLVWFLFLCLSFFSFGNAWNDQTHGVDKVDFFLIGAQKSGTSSLAAWITSHPQTNTPKAKELMFWRAEQKDCGEKNIKKYYRAFPKVTEIKNVTGEFTANYNMIECLPAQLYSMNQETKLIMVLREPARRALSRFLEQRDHCHCPKATTYCGCRIFHSTVTHFNNFTHFFTHFAKQYLSASSSLFPFSLSPSPFSTTPTNFSEGGEEGKKRGPYSSPVTMNDKVKKQHFKALKWVHRGGHSIISQSFYDLFLLSFLEVFPSDQLLVLYTETDLTEQNRLKTMRLIEKFLGLYEYDYPHLRRYHGRGCYGWDNSCENLDTEAQNNTETEDLSPIHRFFSPTIDNLLQLAKAGLIRPPPLEWTEGWGEMKGEWEGEWEKEKEKKEEKEKKVTRRESQVDNLWEKAKGTVRDRRKRRKMGGEGEGGGRREERERELEVARGNYVNDLYFEQGFLGLVEMLKNRGEEEERIFERIQEMVLKKQEQRREREEK